MLSLFNKFRKGLEKTTQKLFSHVKGVFGFKSLDLKTIEELEEVLYLADFGLQTTQEILEEIKLAWKKDKDLQGQIAAKIGASVLRNVLRGAAGEYRPDNGLNVISLVGINGAGKTTTAAKLAYYLKNNGQQVLLGACDTFRAAANEQIAIWSKRLGVDLVASHHGADAASVAFDAYQSARAKGCQTLILDTAGRLHTKHNLMEELKKIRRVLDKVDEKSTRHNWLVLDGNIGSNCVDQARVFHKELELTGLVITKLDGTSRGGALVAIYRELKIPIYFVGLGEGPDDLQPFGINEYVDAIFGVTD